MPEGKKITLELNEKEITMLLIALGRERQIRWDNKTNSKSVDWLIDKIYRAMGVRL